jgi:hypothetical protein
MLSFLTSPCSAMPSTLTVSLCSCSAIFSIFVDIFFFTWISSFRLWCFRISGTSSLRKRVVTSSVVGMSGLTDDSFTACSLEVPIGLVSMYNSSCASGTSTVFISIMDSFIIFASSVEVFFTYI